MSSPPEMEQAVFTDADLSLLSSPVAICGWADGQIAHANTAFETAFDRHDAPIEDHLPQIDWVAARAALEDMASFGCDIIAGTRSREAHYRVHLKRINEGQRILVEAHDIGRVREAEYMLESYARLAERNTRTLEREKETAARILENFTRNAPVGMYVKDGKGRYVLVNPKMETLFGHKVEDIIGKTVRDLLPAAEAEMVETFDREVLATRRTTAVVEELAENDAFEHTLVVRFPIDTPDDPDMIGGFDIDISAQKRAEAELANSQARLMQAERMTAMGSMLAGVSHELNNPLAILVGEATLLEEDAEGTEFKDSAQRIREAADRCARIVQSFLAIAREKPARREAIDLNTSVKAMVRFTENQMRANDIMVALDLADDLPAVLGDADQLQQVFANLLVNALQALQESPLPRHIWVSSFLHQGEVAVRVRDNGPGIAKDVAKRIFDPFFTTKPEGSGTGIGLSYSQGLVEAHGGAIVCESCEAPQREGTGASFLVTLPCATGDCEIAAPERPDRTPVVARRGRALVVDDEPDLASMLARLLERMGFAADTAASGADAIALLGSGRYALVLTDLRMPVMDGIALYEWITQHRPDLIPHTAMITGDTLSPAASSFLGRSGIAYLSKPVTREALAALVEQLVPGQAP